MSDPAAPDREWQRRRRRPYVWTGVAVLASAALVLAAWMVDRNRTEQRRAGKVRQRPVAELVVPSPLSERERDGTGPKFGSQESVRLERGAWVQVADAQGNLKQQYTASRIDPLPDKRLAMENPRAVLYGEGGRIVTMRSDSMTARVPKRALDSGRLAGNVVIRIYRPKDGRPVDLASDAPDVTVESPEATFDAGSGEIRCDREVRIAGEVITFDGEGLSLTLGDDGKSLERLVVDRALAPVRISRAAVEAQAKRREAAKAAAPAAAPAPADPQAKAGSDAPATAARPSAKPAGKGVAKGAAKPAPTPAMRLFQLTLHDAVEVVSNEEDRRTTVRGDRLDAFFMLRSGAGVSLTRADPFGPPAAPFPAVALPGARPQQLAALAIAAVDAGDEDGEEVEEDLVTVAFKGRLVMAPAPEGTAAPATEDGVRMVVVGRPATIEDSRSESTITAATATFESNVERIELVGTVDDPATVETPDFTLGSKHFALDRSKGTGRSDGPGTIVMGGAGSKPLVVSWGTSMALRLEPGTGDAEGTFRGAEFVGEVDVRSPDLELQAGRLAVDAQPVGTKDVPRRIVASGGVRAKALGAARGRFSAETVEIALSPNADGEAQPRTLVATGGVSAGDDAQTLWCTTLRTTFVEPKAAAKGDAARSDLGEIVAEGPVELALADGARVFASRLEGDGAARDARLLGPDVLVVRGNLVLDQLSEIRVQEQPARMSAIGPGRASGFRDPVLAPAEGPVGRPRIAGLPQMQATWRESLAFADGSVKPADGGPARGLLLLQGAVKVRASREPREAEALDADEVQIEIMPKSSARAAAPARAGGDAQSIGTMRATGQVRLEARQWTDGRREGDPRLFRMNAPNIAYDGQDGSALVDGAGSLLVFDPQPEVAPERADEPKSPFSPHGTTRFSWKRSLAMERRPDGSSRITLEREVVMDHLGNSDAATGTVTADRMTASVRGVEGAKPAAGSGDVGMSLGGPAELTKVTADGRVVVRTSELDVEAAEFELDVPTQVGAVRSEPGRLVTIVRRGNSTPMRGHAFRWDLVKGTLAVEGARGTIGR
jgi:hypothetical protein